MLNNKTLKAVVSAGMWSYIVNENGNAIRTTLEGYGSCTPEEALQEVIDKMSPDAFEQVWQDCENKKDVIT